MKHRGIILEIAAVAAILMMGAFLRFYEIQTRPGFEWDEPIYEAIARNTVMFGYPVIEVENGRPLSPFLYHPPFDNYLKGYWFEVTGVSSIGQARILSAIESLVLLLVTYLFVRYVSGRKASLLTLLMISSCGWLVYTNRLNLLENGMMPVGVAGLCVYAIALKKDKSWCFALAGVVLALAAIYKHTGLYFLLVPMLTLLLTRKAWKHHLVLLIAACHIVLFYIAGMYLAFGNDYLFQSLVQVRRALGMGGSSRGLTYGLIEVIRALTSAYWIFFITIVCLITGPAMVMIRLIQYLRRPQPYGSPILLSWSVAAILLLAGVALKSPQYWIVILVPLYAFLATELTRHRVKTWVTTAMVVAILGLNLVTWDFLILQQTNNALQATYDYAVRSIPKDARVLTEECIGVQLEQTYYNIQIHRGVEDLVQIDPTYVILYFSTTAKPPESPGLDVLLLRSTFVTEFIGFKEVIKVYRANEPREGMILAETEPLVTPTETQTIVPIPTSEMMPTIAELAGFSPVSTTVGDPLPTSTPLAPVATVRTQTEATPVSTAIPSSDFSLAEKPLATEETRYVVEKGDSLFTLAVRFYSDGRDWQVIYQANQGIIMNPSVIYQGQVLVIPSLEPKTEY